MVPADYGGIGGGGTGVSKVAGFVLGLHIRDEMGQGRRVVRRAALAVEC